MSALPPDEPARDERLRAALRHAPDRDARPPEALSASILRSAQQAARPTPSPSAASRAWQAVKDGLAALTRPAPAAAFASLMLATVIGVMWQGGPPPEDRAASMPAASRVQESAPPAKPAEVAPAPTAPAAEARSDAAARRSVEATSPQPPKRAAPAVERRAQAESTRDPATQNTAPAAKAAVAAGPAARPEPSTAPAPPAREPAHAEAEIGAARERRAAAPAAVADAATTGRAEDTLARAAPKSADYARLSQSVIVVDPLAALAEAWTDASVGERAALDELRRLSAGRWSHVPAAATVASPSRAWVGKLGQPLGRLTITDDAVFWRPNSIDDRAWRAPLPPGAATGLRERLGLAATR